jgi:Pretoxin HINT domain
MKMKVIVLVIVSWFFQLVVVGENTYNGVRGIGNTNKGEDVAKTNILVKATRGDEAVQIIKSTNAIETGMKEFELVNVLEKGETVAKNIVVGRSTTKACILPTYCFTGNTLIHTPTGAVPFEHLQDGAEILTYNTDNKTSITQTIGRIVRSQATKLVKIFTGGEVIMATPEHPIYESTNGWTLAGNLRKGMNLLLATGLSLSIDSVAAIDTTCTVYNCDVPVTHTYYVGNNAILAHNADVCNKLVEGVLNKLGKGYDAVGVRAGLENIFSKYKLLKTNLTDQEIIEDLAKLCSGNVSPTELSKLLSFIGDDLAKADKFAKDLQQYGLLDDFAKDGKLLDNYKAIRSGDYNGFKNIAGDVKGLYPKYHGFLANINKIMPRLEYNGLTALGNKINSITEATVKTKFISDFADAPVDALKMLNKHPQCVDVWKTYIADAQTLCGSNAVNFAKHFEVRSLLKAGKLEDAVRLYGGQMDAAVVINGIKYVENVSSGLVSDINTLIARTDDITKIGTKLRAAGYNITDDIIAVAKKHYFEAEHLVPMGNGKFVKGRFFKINDHLKEWSDYADIASDVNHLKLFNLIRHEHIEAKLMEAGMPYKSFSNLSDDAFLKYGAHELSPNLIGLNGNFFSHWTNSNLMLRKSTVSVPDINTTFEQIIAKIKQIESL